MKSLKYAVLLIVTITLALSGIAWNHPHSSRQGDRSAGLKGFRLKLCLNDLEKDFDKLVPVDPVPVGCEVIDCCPGCPGPPWDIRWDITVSHPVFESLVLVPVSLRRETPALKLSGVEIIPRGQQFAGAMRLTASQGAISGLLVDQPGRGGTVRPVARFRKDVKPGSYRIDITQRIEGQPSIIRKDQVIFDIESCPKDLPACEANPITSELLQHTFARHSPIYPRASDEVTYTASARGKVAAGVGVTALSLQVQQFRLTEANNGLLVPTLVDTFTESQNFEDAPIEAELTLTVGPFPTDTLVRYKSEAKLADGTTLADAAIRHAANLSEEIIEAFDGAVPVYKRGTHADKFDFLFVPDTDYGDDEDAYLSDIEEFVYDGFFTDPPYRYKRFRRYMNIYMNMLRPGLTGDAEDLDAPPFLLDKPDNFDGEAEPTPDLTWVDVAIIAHSDSFRDWAFTGLAEGNFCSADAPGTATHETLHALMSQKDEYQGNRSQPDIAHPNVFDSEEECEKHVQEHPGFSPGHCKKGPGDSNFFHWCRDFNNDEAHIMDSSSGPTAFMVEERCQVAWAVDNLLGNPQGSKYGPLWVFGCAGFPCDASTRAAASSASKDAQLAEEDNSDQDERVSERALFAENARGKVLMLSFLLKANAASLRGVAVRQGQAPNLGGAVIYKGREKEAPYRVQLFKGKRLVKEFAFNDPRLIAGEEGKHGDEALDEVEWDARLPIDETLKADRVRILTNEQRIALDTRFRLPR